MNSRIRKCMLFIVPLAVFTVSCTQKAEEIDLVNNEAHKNQAFNQILNNPELQQEFMGQLINNDEAMERLMRDRQFTGDLFTKENLNFIWDQNPGIDTAVIDNVTTRMHTDTNFMKKFDSRMERGTPSNMP